MSPPTDPPIETSVHHLDRGLTHPSWTDDDPGTCIRIDDPTTAKTLVDDADTDTKTFVTDTDFDDSILLYVESTGPSSNYDEITVHDIGITDGRVTVSAAVEDTSTEELTFANDVITHPAALLRITADPRPESVSVTIVDGWDRTHTYDV